MMKLSFAKWANAVVGRLSVWGVRLKAWGVARAQTLKLAFKLSRRSGAKMPVGRSHLDDPGLWEFLSVVNHSSVGATPSSTTRKIVVAGPTPHRITGRRIVCGSNY